MNFKEPRRGLNRQKKQEMTLKPVMTCGQWKVNVEPRVQLYVPKEERFTIPLKFVDVTRTPHTNLDVLQESRIDDHRNVDVDRNLSDAWTGCMKFT